jgi:hypothetical protein
MLEVVSLVQKTINSVGLEGEAGGSSIEISVWMQSGLYSTVDSILLGKVSGVRRVLR